MVSKYTQSTLSVKDTFDFVQRVDELNIKNSFMCSLDVQSLFTNVPLEGTIDYICELVSQHGIDVHIGIDRLRELLLFCTKNVQFQFQGKLYRQVDGCAMGSKLGPILAEFCMRMIESKAISKGWLTNIQMYVRYVDDILIFCNSREACNQLLKNMNSLHSNVKFTV